ncbi:histidine phosphatase family protein [Flammeovirga pacifica]|uniref:Alpha-ribazole phosphatase n=1 Tax=Flammeovirga pacifica TaxID=915059 RepID=A0A1S1YSZ6_FLAPC|nr:histidine phosphatase family protein [Flammeovirga pacifica]OHX63983.1 hypothetical protein NH26_20445 [Flammeovirga pacifica]
MEIYVIRHTEVNIPKGICYGQSDVNIQSNHRIDFEKIKASIPDDIDAFITSPLSRCVQLCQYLSDSFLMDERLMECNFGDWELLPWDDIPRHEMDVWGNDFVYQSPPNGESLHQISKRVIDIHQEILQQSYDKIVVVTHASVVRVFHHIYQNIPLENIFDVKVNFGEVFKFSTKSNSE